MCELFGLSASATRPVNQDFAILAERGGRTGPHRDGWGITFYEERLGCRHFKETAPSCCSKLSDFIQATPIRSHLAIAHIRQANRGPVSLQNTHPFTRELWGRCWTFAHNGQLSDYDSLDCGEFMPVGETDSERAFCWILNEMKQHILDPAAQVGEPVFRFIAERARTLSQLGVFNMLLTDGEHLLAYCGSKLSWSSHPEVSPESVAGAPTEGRRFTLVATEPLTPAPWQPLMAGDYALFHQGRCVRCG